MQQALEMLPMGDDAARVINAAQVIEHVAIGPDLQVIQNPGYNRDRGTARFAGARLHVEF